jgi:uncharacterized protein (TIGR00369 family)
MPKPRVTRAFVQRFRLWGLPSPGQPGLILRMSDITRLARQFIEALPHSRSLGMLLESISEGIAVISMPYDARLVGDPETGVIHGGAVSALMDTASGAAVMCHPAAGVSTATLDLRIDYMRPATPGQTIRALSLIHI